MTDFANSIAVGFQKCEEIEKVNAYRNYIEDLCRETNNVNADIPILNRNGFFTQIGRTRSEPYVKRERYSKRDDTITEDAIIIVHKSYLGLFEARLNLKMDTKIDYYHCCRDIQTEMDPDRILSLNTQKQQLLTLFDRLDSICIHPNGFYNIFLLFVDIECDVRTIANNLNRVKTTIRKIVEEDTRKHLNEADKLIHDLQTLVVDYIC
jgi:hypothetical protein